MKILKWGMKVLRGLVIAIWIALVVFGMGRGMGWVATATFFLVIVAIGNAAFLIVVRRARTNMASRNE